MVSAGASALPNDPSAFLLGGATPDAVALTGTEGVLEARVLDGALAAHGLGALRLLLRHRVEDLGVEAPARSLLVPDLGDCHRFRSAPLALSPCGARPPLAGEGWSTESE